MISYGYDAGNPPVFSTYITPGGGTHALVSGQSLSGYGYSYGGYVSDSDEMITYEDGVEVDRITVGSPWSVGWDSNDAPTTAGTYMLVAEWRDRGPVDEGPHTESVSVSLFAPQDYYESNGRPDVYITMGSWGDITGKSVYFAYSDQKTSVLNYANFDSSRGTDTDIHKWTNDQGELLSDPNVIDSSWLATVITGDAVTTAGTYSVTASFQDDDNPRGTTEPEAPAIAGSNDTQGTPIAASGSIWAIALSIEPELTYLCSGTTKSLGAQVTPNPGGEYNWSTPEGSGVVFVLEDGATTRVATGQNVTVKGLSSTGVDGASVSVSFSSNEDDLGRTVGLSDTIIFTVPSISIGGGMELCKGMSETRSVTVTPSGFDHLFSFGVSSSDGGSASVEFDRPSTITVTGSSGGNAIVEAKCEDTVVASFPVVIYEIDISASETSTCEGLTAYIEAEVTPVGSESKFSFDASIPTGVASASWGAEPGTIAVNGGTPGVAVIPISCLGAVVDDITVQVYGITYGPGNPPTTAALSFGGDELPESGGKIYLPFDPAKQNLGQYQRNASGFGGGVGGDMDVRLCQQTIIEDFSDESWLSPDFSAINDQATTTTGIYAATVTFQDNDSPNGTQDGDISRSASVYLVAINIAPEIEYLLMNDTLTMTADVTPEIPGEYYWESLEPDSVLFVTGGGYSSTATGQSVQIIGLNDSSSVDSSVVRAQFQSEEDDTGNSVMIEDTESLTCIYISLASITFNSDHGVMKYAVNYSSEGTDYPYPEWVGSRTVFPSVPISHTRDMYIYITASIVLLPDDLSFPFVLTGQSGKSHLQFSSSGTLGNGGAAISMTSAGKLPNEILPDAGASILWTLTLEDGPTIEPITTGPHEIYVTFGAPVGSYAATNMRMEWSCTQAINAAAIATAAELFCANLASSPGYTGTTLVNSFMININSWEYLDLGSPGDCITLAALACAGLNMLGVGAQYHCSYPTADGSTGYPAVSSTSCHNPTNATFTYQGQDFSARLVYPGNNYEGFFTINDPGIKGYTVYPPRWTFENQDYYYLEVLSSVATDQFWIWDGDQTQNGVSVYNWDVVPGVANIPVPSIPSP